MKVSSLFADHPAAVGETYWEHLCTALFFARTLAQAALAAAIHALFPFACEKTASRLIAMLHQRMVIGRHRT